MTAEPASNRTPTFSDRAATGHKESPSITDDVRVHSYAPLQLPGEMKAALPVDDRAAAVVREGRRAVEGVLGKRDPRLLVITGPCSIHDEAAAMDYARRLCELRDKVADTLLVVMRVYFEKPRTTVGWKGLISDPALDGTCDMQAGLIKARRILQAINSLGMPAATEMLEPFTPQYTADLVCWSAIGARTTESQTHREMASGLSMPVGFKNGTDGNLNTAVNALLAARAPQTFLGIDHEGRASIVNTGGNPWGHIVLRGGKRPNYDPISIEQARLMLIDKGLPEAIVVDCSHANSMKMHQGQGRVWQNVLDQRLAGNDAIVGMMLESNLNAGNQKYTGNVDDLAYGVSITDECISWETTEELLLSAHDKIKNAG